MADDKPIKFLSHTTTTTTFHTVSATRSTWRRVAGLVEQYEARYQDRFPAYISTFLEPLAERAMEASRRPLYGTEEADLLFDDMEYRVLKTLCRHDEEQST